MSTFAGLPAHPLFVHAAVVLVPSAALVLLAYAFWPPARERLGAASPVLALVALVSAKIAEGAGEALERTARLEPGADLAALVWGDVAGG